MQFDLLSQATPERIELSHGELWWYPHWLTEVQANLYLSRLTRESQWQQSVLSIAGKSIPIPRLNAWYGEPGTEYAYSGVKFSPLTFTRTLNGLRGRIQKTCLENEALSNATFNSALLNYYRDGRDSVTWHADDELELGRQPIIASVSLGATRRFVMKLKHKKSRECIEMNLTHGSLLVMGKGVQQHWLHSIPKTNHAVDSRLNVTFRRVVGDGERGC